MKIIRIGTVLIVKMTEMGSRKREKKMAAIKVLQALRFNPIN